MIFLNSLILLAIDTFWLSFIKTHYNKVITSIQGGSPPLFRPLYAIPVYIALGYLLMFPKTKGQAFFLGLCTYAIYDFTVLTLFHKYPLNIALMDTLWGGTLFVLVKFLYHKVSQMV